MNRKTGHMSAGLRRRVGADDARRSMRRKLLLALGASALAAPLRTVAQQQGKVWRIGFLSPRGSLDSLNSDVLGAFLRGMRELGYVEEKNLVIEWRWAEGKYDRLPELAAELVRLNVELIVTSGTPGIRAAKQATTTIPIVMAASGDAVAMGLIDSLARPGGNITGSTFFILQLMGKRMELLRDAMPRIKQIAFMFNRDNPAAIGPVVEAVEIAAKSLKLAVQQFGVRGPNDFDSAFSAMAKRRVDAMVTGDDALILLNAKRIADLAAKHRILSAGSKALAEAGGLMAYGVNLPEMFRRAAYFVDRILKGTKPGDLPVEQPTKFEIVVNLKTAKVLGIKIPDVILLRADKVIE
jgi:putative ABC transport system substrate-binding protein